jgi:GNAT superfamily N-acetyltransferase
MAAIVVRQARPGDGEALARIHKDMAAYYVERFPGDFRIPALEGLEDELDAELGEPSDTTLRLVAEVDGDVVGALVARVLPPEDGAEREIVPELAATRLRIEYLATDRRHQRRGVGTRLVDEAEVWGRGEGATLSETWTYARSPLSMPFWTQRMGGYRERSVSLRKRL